MRALSKRLGVSWRAVDTRQQRSVPRGLERRDAIAVRRIGIDETSLQKRPEYVTVSSDLLEFRVLFVADDRKTGGSSPFCESVFVVQRQAIECGALDMWQIYGNATVAAILDASTKIALDRLLVTGCIHKAGDDARKMERRELRVEGSDRLKGTKCQWQMGAGRQRELEADVRRALNRLIGSTLKSARAWALKEAARGLSS